jgi:hypothetical protein
MWCVKYFKVDIHDAVPGLTTAPLSRVDAESVARIYHAGLYAIIVKEA